MIRVEKQSRRLIFEPAEGETLTFRVMLGREPAGKKKREGDGRTPEGRYYVCTKNAASKFFLSLGLSYPNPDDAREALEEGRIDRSDYDAVLQAARNGKRPPWDTPLGGFIMIHGEREGASGDWTEGCIALKNGNMKRLFESVGLGEEVIITE